MNYQMLKSAKIVLILVLASYGAVCAHAQEAPSREWRTGFSWNGRFWKASMPFAKTGFLLGYEQALVYMGARQFAEYSKFEEFKKHLYPALTISETESAMDRFYEMPENGPIGVNEALHIIAERVNGGSVEEIEKLTADARKSAASTLAIEHR